MDREAILATREHRSAEQELQWDAAVAQRMHVLGRRDLEVIRALQGQIHLSGAGESLHHRGGVQPQERVLRRGPAFAWAEQVQQAGSFVVGVAASHRVDADLTAQGDRVDRIIAVRRDSDTGHQDRCHRVGLRCHVQDGEGDLTHPATTLLRVPT